MATAIIGTLKHLPKASILPTLPETGRPNRIYFIPNVDQKIIESAIIFWFKDVDCKSRNKVVSYFKEY